MYTNKSTHNLSRPYDSNSQVRTEDLQQQEIENPNTVVITNQPQAGGKNSISIESNIPPKTRYKTKVPRNNIILSCLDNSVCALIALCQPLPSVIYLALNAYDLEESLEKEQENKFRNIP